ncbi:unnamed protein product [Didymodactylos carnosus]|uniref:Uncharacterized protein n=1 Tax=Didymodactylos carnosus TaxID=1234261 RepID=A0A816F8M7_9BILA|nr:unnamed protein product [Didymodactylos carnosus]CAF4595539.1 unnamed protein product [Didymodactylos carnosus]
MLMQDEIQQSQQIRAVADWDQEKLNEMNERKNWEQKQLNDFRGNPLTEADEAEQLRQIDTVAEIQEEIRTDMNLNDQWDQERLYQYETLPTPLPYGTEIVHGCSPSMNPEDGKQISSR